MLGRVRAFRIGLIVAAGAACGLMLNLPLVLIVATVVSFTIFASLFLGLTDALAVAELTAPERQYGALRAHASLSYAIALVGVGFLYSWAGYGAAPAVFLVWAAMAFFLVGRVRGRTNAASTRGAWKVDAEPSRRLGSIGRAFSVQPRLWLVLAVFAVAFAGMQAALAFIGIRIVELGGQPSDVALSFSVSALMEIPGLVAAGWMGRRLGLRWLFAISLVLYGACITSWGILPSAVAINATRLVTGVAFGSLTAARVLLVPRLLPESCRRPARSWWWRRPPASGPSSARWSAASRTALSPNGFLPGRRRGGHRGRYRFVVRAGGHDRRTAQDPGRGPVLSDRPSSSAIR